MSDHMTCWSKAVNASLFSQCTTAHLTASGCWSPLPSIRSTYLAMTSTSRLTGSPGCLMPSVVSARVVGMRLTVK